MFNKATSFNQPLNNWNTAAVVQMDCMYQPFAPSLFHARVWLALHSPLWHLWAALVRGRVHAC